MLNKISKNEPLMYNIQFQNTGTAPAHKVIIRDTLDSDLDITALQLLSESHGITKFEILPPNVLVWTFDNINLPDSSSDFEGSKGFVQYQINHLPNLVDGTTITNKTSIFFDQNEPVITNTTLNTLFDNPEPVASFTSQRQCSQNAYDFFYTGGSTSITAFWNFGADATPQISTDLNPTGITFNTPGANKILLIVEDITGCSSSIKDTIEVADITCGNNKDKILICHRPQGQPQNRQLLCINPASLNDHLTHGDCIGECDAISAKSSLINYNKNISELNQVDEYYCNIYPNPFNDKIQIVFVSAENTFLEITIIDLFGKLVATVSNKSIKSNEVNSFEFEDNESLHSGIFFCKVRTDNMQKVYKVIKLK